MHSTKAPPAPFALSSPLDGRLTGDDPVPMTFQTFVLAQATGVAAFNAFCNGAYTWFLWRTQPELPIFGAGGVGIDLASTPMWIAALSTLLGAPSVRKALRAGRVSLPSPGWRRVMPSLPSGLGARALVLALAAGAVFSAPTAMLLHISGLGPVPPESAVFLKVALTVPLSLIIVPLVVLSAVADVSPRRATSV
jgi:hypothetical protein